ncbi:hypothetical protein [Mesorhizobium sp. M1E.F.Ca.ET.063.01.1.1]|nr:hypothetical protein [Mesorhizobium sp. M1E.F.Ca.ET.063.01.1.1]
MISIIEPSARLTSQIKLLSHFDDLVNMRIADPNAVANKGVGLAAR